MTSNKEPSPTSRLTRKLTTFDAVVIGMGAMIGAGIFAVIAPAVDAAGSGVLIALLLAGCVAYCNATSSAQLAAVYPESGGAYVYGRERLGLFWGYLAGWGFLVGKTASCAAMALTFASYAAPPEMTRPLAVGAVLTLTLVNFFGVKKTAVLTRVIVALVLLALVVVVVAALAGNRLEPSRLAVDTHWTLYGLSQAAGLWFFAFAGYARLATLGEEVQDPARTIPRAIPIALLITLCLYALVAATALLAADMTVLSGTSAPLAAVVEAGDWSHWSPVVRIGAAIASLGVLLSLIVGVSRTTFAMAANRDFPTFFDKVHPRYRVPHRAELMVGILVALVVAVADLRSAIGFSAFTVLTYYAITNAAALRLSPDDRRWPRWLAIAGFVGCCLLAFSSPAPSVVSGVAILLLGAFLFFMVRLTGKR